MNTLFKAKTKDGKWVEGYYFAKPILDRYFIICDEEQWEIDKNTLCRFTGLFDKNGKRIWENDLFKHYNGKMCDCDNDCNYEWGIVLWDAEKCRFTNYNIDMHVHFTLSSECEYEVVGSVADNNPEKYRYRFEFFRRTVLDDGTFDAEEIPVHILGCNVFLLGKTFEEMLTRYLGHEYRVIDIQGKTVVGGVMDPADVSILNKEMLAVFMGHKGGAE